MPVLSPRIIECSKNFFESTLTIHEYSFVEITYPRRAEFFYHLQSDRRKSSS